MIENDHIVLAIESAISGGSISLQTNGREIANWIGSSNVSKAEDLLANIDEILTSAGVLRHDISLIAVSAGPGSFTGIRIGLATALGFKTGLGIKLSSQSALKAIASECSANGDTIIAVPVGRNSVCVQKFNIDIAECKPLDEPHTLTDDDFYELASAERHSSLVLHSALFERVEPAANIINFGSNIAYAIGQFCSNTPDTVIEPLFISKSF